MSVRWAVENYKGCSNDILVYIFFILANVLNTFRTPCLYRTGTGLHTKDKTSQTGFYIMHRLLYNAQAFI